jgi:holin-like protein
MLRTLTTLLVFQLIGETISFGLVLPVPGPVLGMALLFAYLVLRKGEAQQLQETAQTLLRHLSLLFVPAGVGVTLYFETVAREWLPILVSLVVSTAATILATALTVRYVGRLVAANRATAELPDDRQ